MTTPEPNVSTAPRSLSRMDAFERLASPIPDRSQSVPLPPLTTTRKLTKVEEHSSIEHLYTQSIARKREKLEKLERFIYKDSTPHMLKVEPEELNSIVSRLYERSIEEKASRLLSMTQERLRVHRRKVKKVESKEELASILDRLYNTSAKEKERSDALFDKYNPSIPVLKRSKAELEANDERYYKGGFARKS